jgi:hypothetical protein
MSAAYKQSLKEGIRKLRKALNKIAFPGEKKQLPKLAWQPAARPNNLRGTDLR